MLRGGSDRDHREPARIAPQGSWVPASSDRETGGPFKFKTLVAKERLETGSRTFASLAPGFPAYSRAYEARMDTTIARGAQSPAPAPETPAPSPAPEAEPEKQTVP